MGMIRQIFTCQGKELELSMAIAVKKDARDVLQQERHAHLKATYVALSFYACCRSVLIFQEPFSLTKV
jgi:hypothetical protein